MENEEKVYTKKEVFSEMMKKLYVFAKVCYIICLIAAPVLVILGVVFGLNNTIDGRTTGETIISFSVLALYAFSAAGLLWNVEMLFKDMGENGSPFSEKSGHYITKTARFLLILSVVPALIGKIAMGILSGITKAESELQFDFGFGGIIFGLILLYISLAFDYGYKLENKDKEKNKE